MKTLIAWATLLAAIPCLVHAEQPTSPFYAGVFAGVQRLTVDELETDDGVEFVDYKDRDTAIMGGIYAGVGKEFDNGFYAAFELEGNISNAEASDGPYGDPCNGSAKVKREESIGAYALLGKAIQTSIAYFKAGRVRTKFNPGGCLTGSDTENGTSIGLGYSHDLMGLWAFRAEFAHVRYTGFDEADENNLKLGITRHF